MFFTVKPYLKLPKTATFIEGEKVELECVIHASPLPREISWKFGKCLHLYIYISLFIIKLICFLLILENKTIIITDDKYKFLSNKNNISNAILVFNPITMANRGNYACSAKSDTIREAFIDSNVIYVRIKGNKYLLIIYGTSCTNFFFFKYR